jgi:hypothetical protein
LQFGSRFFSVLLTESLVLLVHVEN